MTAFATYTDLGLRLNRTFTSGSDQAWVTALLEDAASYIRGVIGNDIYPALQSTYVAYPQQGRIRLPQSLVVSVDAVSQIDPATSLPAGVSWTQCDPQQIWVPCDLPTTVTFTHGLAAPPNDLIGFNCVIVSQQMITVAAGIGLSAAGLSSVAIDDFKAAWADAGAGTGMTLSEDSQAYLRKRYGTSMTLVL